MNHDHQQHHLSQYQKALKALRKRLRGDKLNYREIYAIMDEIAHDDFDPVLTTYFAASGYVRKLNREEIYFLTKAMVETGHRLEVKGIAADKHSIGGLPGTRSTLIIVPLLASLGIPMLSTPSRAITTPSGTADDMELLAPVSFTIKQIKSLFEKVGACIIWGGSLHIAPADDKLIQVEKPLLDESLDKILVSIMAKKVATGMSHVVIEIPVGPEMKIKTTHQGQKLGRDFVWLGSRFGIKIRPVIIPTHQPAGGVGPLLETREALRVLQRKPNRSPELENRALLLAYNLLDLILGDRQANFQPDHIRPSILKSKQAVIKLFEAQLDLGLAWQKMSQIIKAQGGKDPNIDSEDLTPKAHTRVVKAQVNGVIKKVKIKNINRLCRILGAPRDKNAGLVLKAGLGQKINKGDDLVKLFASDKIKLKEAYQSLAMMPIYQIV